MLEHVAKDIASIASNIIGYYIVITDENGIIIGTSKEFESRLGTLHEGSLAVIRKREMVTHNEKDCAYLKGTFPGVTVPIILRDEVVGTIGIGGVSTQVKRYGMLVKSISEVMLRDRIEAESLMIRHQNRQILTNMILAFDKNVQNAEAVQNYAKVLGYDLELKRRAVLIKMGNDDKELHHTDVSYLDYYKTLSYSLIKKYCGSEQDIIVALRESKYLVCYMIEPSREEEIRENMRELAKCLQKELRQNVHIGIGGQCSSVVGLKESYEQGQNALRIAYQSEQGSVVMIEDVPLERLLIELSDVVDGKIWEENMSLLQETGNVYDLKKIITIWVETGFNFTSTCRRLDVHRNTLIYRFKKLKEEYGIDLYDYKRVLAIYLTIAANQFK